MIAPLDDYLKDDYDDVLTVLNNRELMVNLLGYSESNVGVYYNKKMFKEAGIDEVIYQP